MRTREQVSREGIYELLKRHLGSDAKTLSQVEDFTDICFWDNDVDSIENVLLHLFYKFRTRSEHAATKATK